MVLTFIFVKAIDIAVFTVLRTHLLQQMSSFLRLAQSIPLKCSAKAETNRNNGYNVTAILSFYRQCLKPRAIKKKQQKKQRS